MTSEAILRKAGMEALVERLGSVDAVRFIASIIRDPFDYTDWQEDLFDDLTIEELSSKAQ